MLKMCLNRLYLYPNCRSFANPILDRPGITLYRIVICNIVPSLYFSYSCIEYYFGGAKIKDL